MSVLIIAQLKFTDEPSYRTYQAAFMSVFGRFSGEVLVADESPEVLEGQQVVDKLFVLEFSSRTEAMAFINDPEYQQISANRHAGAETCSVLVRMLDRRRSK